MVKEEREAERPLPGKDVGKNAKKYKNENLIPPCKTIEEETIGPLCLDSHEWDCMQCGNY